jgi:hypothetical protein
VLDLAPDAAWNTFCVLTIIDTVGIINGGYRCGFVDSLVLIYNHFPQATVFDLGFRTYSPSLRMFLLSSTFTCRIG